MKFKVLIGGIGLREVEAEEIDGAYAAAVRQFNCRYEDILAVGPCVTIGEYLKKTSGKSCLGKDAYVDSRRDRSG